MDLITAATVLGVPTSEIASVDDSPAGDVVVTTDGVAYLIVPEDRPDGAGRTGLMFLAAPHEGYVGPFPVYTMPADEEPVVADPSDEGEREPVELSREELVEHARQLGIEVGARWGDKRIAEAIDAALAERAATEARAVLLVRALELGVDDADMLDDEALAAAIADAEAAS